MTWAEFFCWYGLVGFVLCAHYQRSLGNAAHWWCYPVTVIAWPALIIASMLPDDL